MQHKLPKDYLLIDKERHEQLNTTQFNPAADGMKDKNRFSDRFNDEIDSVMKACSEFLAQRGEFGSQERYDRKLPSDWWINIDFFSVDRVLCIELLDTRMQTIVIIEGLRDILRKLPFDWMLLVGHDNTWDNRGKYVGAAGEYYFWVRKDGVEIYSERPEDLSSFYHSLVENVTYNSLEPIHWIHGRSPRGVRRCG